MLESAKFYEKIEKDTLFIRVHDAVLSALARDPDLQAVVCNHPCVCLCFTMLSAILQIIRIIRIQLYIFFSILVQIQTQTVCNICNIFKSR